MNSNLSKQWVETPRNGYLNHIRGTHQDDHDSDLRGANSDDPAVKRHLAAQIRDASINIGLFYGPYCSDTV